MTYSSKENPWENPTSDASRWWENFQPLPAPEKYGSHKVRILAVETRQMQKTSKKGRDYMWEQLTITCELADVPPQNGKGFYQTYFLSGGIIDPNTGMVGEPSSSATRDFESLCETLRGSTCRSNPRSYTVNGKTYLNWPLYQGLELTVAFWLTNVREGVNRNGQPYTSCYYDCFFFTKEGKSWFELEHNRNNGSLERCLKYFAERYEERQQSAPPRPASAPQPQYAPQPSYGGNGYTPPPSMASAPTYDKDSIPF